MLQSCVFDQLLLDSILYGGYLLNKFVFVMSTSLIQHVSAGSMTKLLARKSTVMASLIPMFTSKVTHPHAKGFGMQDYFRQALLTM